MIVKMIILKLLGSSDDKEKIGVARIKIEETVKKSSQKDQNRDNLLSPVKTTIGQLHSPVQWTQKRPNQESTLVEPTRVS